MITRCVERDQKRMAQKVLTDKAPNHEHALQRLEANMTARDAKKPVFQFTRSNPQTKTGAVGSVSLSGSGALTVIADANELQVPIRLHYIT